MQLTIDVSEVENIYKMPKLDTSSFIGLQSIIPKGFQKITDTTKTISEQTNIALEDDGISATNYENSAIEQINRYVNSVANDRIGLLLRSNSKNLSEEVIRFRILTERIEKLSPLVTKSESDYLTTFTDSLSTISERQKKRKKFIDTINPT